MSSDCNRRRLETIPAAAVGGEKEVDRISELPDEIIHRILSLVDPQKEAAKASVLSHGWSKLWRSYPILEFHNTQFDSTESAERFAAAASEKFSRSIAVEAVRIKFTRRKKWGVKFCSAFLDNMLDLAAKRSPSPQEIDIEAEFDRKTYSHFNFDGSGTYSIPRGLLLPRSNSNPNHRFRLKILKLVNCNFDRFKDIEINSNHFSGLGSSLRQLFLTQVSFPAGCQILSSIIAGASLLQELFLCVVPGIWRLQFRNLDNLKVLDIHECPVEYLEITGVHSLETLYITQAPLGGDFVVSSMPNLKSLNIHDASKLTQEKFDELISKSPSLESLSVGGLAKVQELKIFNADKLWRLCLSCWAQLRAIEMKAPKLCDFRYSGRIDFFIKILGEVGSYRKEARQSLEARYWSFGTDEKEFHALRKFLAQLTQFWFRLTLDFYFRKAMSIIGKNFRKSRLFQELNIYKSSGISQY
ncbi:unnamed protein product [Linum tenue]|uniref:F-box domain-containing protein n=1 Tax=Linum tenue TaxID=586396 RepID=A0AAV0GZ47_9ROSI|nr:unnamed protein product [Linum tenue]